MAPFQVDHGAKMEFKTRERQKKNKNSKLKEISQIIEGTVRIESFLKLASEAAERSLDGSEFQSVGVVRAKVLSKADFYSNMSINLKMTPSVL